MSQTAGRRRQKPKSRVERMFDEVKALVSGGQHRQSAAKKTGAARIRGGKQRQAAAKKAARTRRTRRS
ncbi:MAG: hypothetical protein JO130_11695 [Solirubrobacterales bacterium]|nr:hypothetical protein [Solirubrobacterales bacterium]